MKNLYKIEDELYVVSNTEGISENCWIITNDKLVQVSYLLADEVVKGFKVILTTNKLLIKEGVQAIDDDFLEWFVKNPSCDEVEVISELNINGKNGLDRARYVYKIIIPKEENKTQGYICPQTKLQCDDECCVSAEDCHIESGLGIVSDYEPPKQETLEEAAEKFEDDCTLVSDSAAYKGFIEGAKWTQEKMYSEEEFFNLCRVFATFVGRTGPSYKKQQEWFEQYKKK